MPTPPQTPRSCGPCSLCCRAPAIPLLAKPAGQPCDLLTPATPDSPAQHCSVWHHRSAPEFADCRSFQCLWLQGHFSDSDRPDLLQVAFAAKPDPDRPNHLRIQALESTPGAAGQPRPTALIRQFLANNQTVAITNPNFVIAILPTGQAWHYPIDPADPLHSRIDPNTKPIPLTLAGKPINR